MDASSQSGACSEQDAWQSHDRGEFATAAAIWEVLIACSDDDSERDGLEQCYCYALVGLKRFDDARAICRRLYEKTGSHIQLHQLGMVEREAGEYAEAIMLFNKERSLLADDDLLACAANQYERGLLESLIGNRDSALILARECHAKSMETDDQVMHGCAWRLLGDLSRDDSPEMARGHYERSRRAFMDAGDDVACRGIDGRLSTLE